MYKGLDIITNKVTAEEQAQCAHHLLSVLSPLSMNNTVVDFRNMALPVVSFHLFHQPEKKKFPQPPLFSSFFLGQLLWILSCNSCYAHPFQICYCCFFFCYFTSKFRESLMSFPSTLVWVPVKPAKKWNRVLHCESGPSVVVGFSFCMYAVGSSLDSARFNRSFPSGHQWYSVKITSKFYISFAKFRFNFKQKTKLKNAPPPTPHSGKMLLTLTCTSPLAKLK